jgi:predicted MFS family arabinose efflux permease
MRSLWISDAEFSLRSRVERRGLVVVLLLMLLLLLLLLLLLTETFALFLTARILLPRAHGLVEPEAFV